MGNESTETTVARMDERIEGISRELTQLSSSMRQMADAVTSLIKDNSRLDTLQAQFTVIIRTQEDLWSEIRKVSEDSKAATHRLEEAHWAEIRKLDERITTNHLRLQRSASSGMWDVIKILIGAGIAVLVESKWGKS